MLLKKSSDKRSKSAMVVCPPAKVSGTFALEYHIAVIVNNVQLHQTVCMNLTNIVNSGSQTQSVHGVSPSI